MRKCTTTAWTFLIFCTKKVKFWSCFDVIVDLFLQPETQFDQSTEPEAERRLRAAEGACVTVTSKMLQHIYRVAMKTGSTLHGCVMR